MTTTLYEQLGGERKLRAIIDRFVQRVTEDIMIGFFFRNFDIDRLREMEFQHAAEFLGADIKYTGRKLDAAHRRHRIAGGQFARRRQILKEALDEHQVDPAIRDAWLAHVDSLRPLITGEDDSTCHGRKTT
jgi:hemoglobin